MRIRNLFVETSLNHPRTVMAIMVILTFILALMIPAVKVDTDPENMLSEDEAVRVFHNRMKKLFDLSDIVVLGVVNEKHPEGVFNPQSLSRIHALTKYAIRELKYPAAEGGEQSVGSLLAQRYGRLWRWLSRAESGPAAGELISGIIERNVIAPSEIDIMVPLAAGGVDFNPLMREPPTTQAEALAIRDKVMRNPMFHGTLVSEDGKALCVYLPLVSKDISHSVYTALRARLATPQFQGDEQYFITGLPVAEDTFGVEMFIQMAVSAPAAMAVIFLLMLLFFRKLALILSPMILALVTVILTMGLLIGTGHTVHIMSSMIPIFIMPIAVLDSIHILSEFFDRYQATRDRRATISKVMDELFVPMLYTSLTSAAGFASLALTPIPPVQVFGIFVALGVMLAWVLTVTFIPAYIMLLKDTKLANFGSTHHEEGEPTSALGRFLAWVGRLTYRRAWPILVGAAVVAAVAGWGISRIVINDNPVKWFTPSHPIRVADEKLNEHFGGTYMAYLALEPSVAPQTAEAFLPGFIERMRPRIPVLVKQAGPKVPEVFAEFEATARSLTSADMAERDLLPGLKAHAAAKKAAADQEDDLDASDAWTEAEGFVDIELQRLDEPAKWPAFLNYVHSLQERMAELGVVGKSNSIADAVMTVHRDFNRGDEAARVVPATFDGVGQMIDQFGNSNRPHDIYHMVTRDFRRATVWVQLHSGDNRDMQRVVAAVDEFFRTNPPPMPIAHRPGPMPQVPRDEPAASAEQQAGWFGLTYINIEWQQKMVSGMLMAFLGSFLVVFLMMTVLFRSALWGLLSMIPLTVTIAFIYGLVGILGIDYDMPIAVLSSLTLGLAVDFAIHFLARSRKMVAEHGSWEATAVPVFGEPARAITRNIIVIAVGFLPLLFAPLNPYKTVGVFLATILLTSGVGTLLILPALIRVLHKWLFRERTRPMLCYCGTCIVSGLAAIAVVAVNVWQYVAVGITALTYVSIPLVVVLLAGCCLMSRRESCAARAAAKEVSSD